MTRRKIIRVLFWGLLGYTAISTTIVWLIQFGLIPTPSFTDSGKNEKKVASAQQIPFSEVTFAEKFAREYFLWSAGQEKVRMQRLKSFLHEKVDAQAGLNIKDSEYSSYPQNVGVWSVEKHPKQKGVAKVTVYVETLLVNQKDSEDRKRVNRYIVVPIKKAGSSFLVVDQPYLVAPPVASSVPVDNQTEPEGEAVNDTETQEVKSFLQSFWKVYTTGKPQEIAYYQKSQEPTPGLTGILSFVGMDDKVSVVKKGDQYVVECDVRLKDLMSGAQIAGNYQFTLVKEGDRFYVLNMEEGEI